MRYLLSPFFAIGLIATTLPSLALLTIIKASPYRSFIISFVILSAPPQFFSPTSIQVNNPLLHFHQKKKYWNKKTRLKTGLANNPLIETYCSIYQK